MRLHRSTSRCKINRLILAVVIAVLPQTVLPADYMRCGTGLVGIGDIKEQVLRACGEPTSREVISGEQERRVERWVYDFGEGRLLYVLTFRGITLVDIQTMPA